MKNNSNNDFVTFQNGVSTIVAAVNAKAGTSHTTSTAPSTIAATISNFATPSGTKSITSNGTYDVKNYASAYVSVPNSGITPSGTKSITSNGTYDVTNYASASVNVSIPSGYYNLSNINTLTIGIIGWSTRYKYIQTNSTYEETNSSINANIRPILLFSIHKWVGNHIAIFKYNGSDFTLYGGSADPNSITYSINLSQSKITVSNTSKDNPLSLYGFVLFYV